MAETTIGATRLESLEQWSPTAFMVGGFLLLVDAAVVAATIATGADSLLVLGQAFVGLAWTAALLGLLGLYPELSGRSRWLSRVGAVFAGIGAVVFGVMAAASLLYFAGIPAGEYGDIGQFFIPGVLVGSVLGFGSFAAASLRSDVHSLTFGVLLLVPPVLVVANILRFVAGMVSPSLTLAIVVADALAMLGLGCLLRAESTSTDPADPVPR